MTAVGFIYFDLRSKNNVIPKGLKKVKPKRCAIADKLTGKVEVLEEDNSQVE